MSQISIPVSIGELIDKITILEIKTERILDVEKQKTAALELNALNESLSKEKFPSDLFALKQILKDINQKLWVIEDDIREKELKQEFDDEFIELARKVYFTNDKRFEIKNKINIMCNSHVKEVKSYQNY